MVIEDGVHDSLCGYVSDVAHRPEGFLGNTVEPFKPFDPWCHALHLHLRQVQVLGRATVRTTPSGRSVYGK
jgi:hypothetical protein